jgi:hypothetical protein
MPQLQASELARLPSVSKHAPTKQTSKPLLLPLTALLQVNTSFTFATTLTGPTVPEYTVPLMVNLAQFDTVSKATLDNVSPAETL